MVYALWSLQNHISITYPLKVWSFFSFSLYWHTRKCYRELILKYISAIGICIFILGLHQIILQGFSIVK